MEASPIIALSMTLYKFVVCSTLRTVMEPLVTFRAPFISENLYPWVSKDPNERTFFLRSGTCLTSLSVCTHSSNIFMRMLSIPIVLHATPLLQKAYVCWITLSLGTCRMCTPSQATKHPRTSICFCIDSPTVHHSTAFLATPAWFDCFSLVLAPTPKPSFFFSISLCLKLFFFCPGCLQNRNPCFR